jgi:malonyl CoA-acyl carrier protein transacylase
MIGHTKCAAGVAGLVKVALALHHRVLPPTLNVDKPSPKAFKPDSPFYVNTEARPWISRPDGTPRRAGVSSFGFGGTNFHVTVEEYPDEVSRAALHRWTSELLVWTGAGRGEIAESVAVLERDLAAGATPLLRDLAYSLWQRSKERRSSVEAGAVTLAIVATSLEDLRQKMTAARQALTTDGAAPNGPRGVYFTETPIGRDARVAFLFPGQGSQHVDMLRELAVHFHEVREAFASADRVLADRYPHPLSAYVFPPPVFADDEARARQAALTETNVAQPALGAANLGLARLLGSLGLTPGLVAGHSYGEYVALCAAGVMDEDTLFSLSEARGRAILDTAGDDLGAMAAVPADRERTEAVLGGLSDVWVANINGPSQTMISGTHRGIDEAIGRLAAQGLQARSIPVSCAFHSPLVARARDTLAARVAGAELREPRIDVFSNVTAAAYPSDPASVAAILADHLVRPVRFAEQVVAMYEAGARVFVEVGPKSVLTNLVEQNLGERPHVAVAPGAGGRAGLLALQLALAQLLAHGVPLQLDRLFEGRDARRLDLANLVAATREAPLSPTAWLVHGGRAWPAREPVPVPPTPTVAALPVATPSAAASAAPLPPPPVETPLVVAPVAAGVPAAPAAPESSRRPAVADANPGAADVMVQFQRLMDRFLETQRNVMLAFLQTPVAAPSTTTVPSMKPAPVAQPIVTPPDHDRAAVVPETLVAARNGGPSGNGKHPHPVEVAGRPEIAKAGVDRAALTEGLLKIVSERTGYPTEMLDLDLNMEADLGIDSIKRVEILGVFQRTQIPGPSQELMERLTGVKTLRQVLDIAADVPATTTPPVAVSAPSPTPPAPAPAVADVTDVPRWLVAAVEAPLSDLPPLSVTNRLLIVTDDRGGVASVVVARLRDLGARVVVIEPGSELRQLAADVYSANLADPAHCTAFMAIVRREHGAPVGMIHLAPLRKRPALDELDLDGWRGQLAQDVDPLFFLVKALDGDIKRAAAGETGFMVSATTMGGAFGSDGSPEALHPEQGAVAGLVKTLALEWPAVRCKVIDMESHLPSAQKAELVLREMAASDGKVEVGYRAGRRLVLRPCPAAFGPDAAPRLTIDSSWVFLVTGGARGITAEVAGELAARYRPTLILTGRSPLPAPDEPAETAGLTGQTLKRALIQQMSRSGRQPELPRVEAAHARLLRDREIRQNLAAMREAGATVRYQAVDVRDERAFAAFLDEAYATYGRLDGVIHGAGVIEDKLLEDKGVDSFRRVIGTKLDGAHVLMRKLRPESMKLLVFFSSVAARFGNRGQADYAAANEVLNKLAIHLDHAWPGRVVAVGWGPWGKKGMVSAEVERQFLERGVQIIPPAAGRRVLDEEIRLGAKGQSEVILGGGGWETAPAPVAVRAGIALPLLNGSVPTLGKSGVLELFRPLDPSHDIYLLDHRLDGKPVFPAAMAMELMAEVVQQGWPERWVAGVRSLRVLRGIVLGNGPKTIGVTARPQVQSSDGDGVSVDVAIFEADTPERASYRATVQLTDRMPAAQAEPVPGLVGMPPFPMSVAEAYDRWLFHGPVLQGITTIEGMNEHGISALVRPSSPEHLVRDARGQWLVDPVLMDCAFQLAILWARAYHDATSIPSKVGRYRRLGLPSGAPVHCHLRFQPSAGDSILNARILFVEADGRALGALEDMEFTCSKALNRAGGTATRTHNGR